MANWRFFELQQRVFFLDVLRCTAALAVVSVHVVSPYRQFLGNVPCGYWLIALTVDELGRSAVPIFIMISGALFLSDTRPFNLVYYIRRRVLKVLIPFLVWSVFYAVLSGWSKDGFESWRVHRRLLEMPFHGTYYHLNFFYYFIPLYFVIPVLRPLVQRMNDRNLNYLVLLWLGLTTLFLFRIEGFWTYRFVLYTGYLILGYVMWQRHWLSLRWLLPLGVISLAVTLFIIIEMSLSRNDFTVGRLLSLKTVNRVLIAAPIFASAFHFSEYIVSPITRQVITFVGRYSLGLYLLHPIFLWPLREYELHWGHLLPAMLFWSVFAGGSALAITWLLALHKLTAWIVP